MPDQFSISVDDRELQRAIRRLGEEAKDGTEPLTNFYALWKLEVGKAWGRIKAGGGVFRGHNWPGMKPQYVRKTDGVEVPAWGGVRKLYGRGNVKGKKRPSGQRVRKSSVLVQDKKELLGGVVSDAPMIIDKRTLRIGGNMKEHAEAQFIDNKRNPLFFAAGDDRILMRQVKKYWRKLAEKFNRGV